MFWMGKCTNERFVRWNLSTKCLFMTVKIDPISYRSSRLGHFMRSISSNCWNNNIECYSICEMQHATFQSTLYSEHGLRTHFWGFRTRKRINSWINIGICYHIWNMEFRSNDNHHNCFVRNHFKFRVNAVVWVCIMKLFRVPFWFDIRLCFIVQFNLARYSRQ